MSNCAQVFLPKQWVAYNMHLLLFSVSWFAFMPVPTVGVDWHVISCMVVLFRGKFVSLENLSCKIKPGCKEHPPWPGGICTKCQPNAVTLNRQVRRLILTLHAPSSSFSSFICNSCATLSAFWYLTFDILHCLTCYSHRDIDMWTTYSLRTLSWWKSSWTIGAVPATSALASYTADMNLIKISHWASRLLLLLYMNRHRWTFLFTDWFSYHNPVAQGQ